MPSGAHFQAAQSILDEIDYQTNQGIDMGRKELMLALGGAIAIQRRSINTYHQVLDNLIRIGCVKKAPNGILKVVKAINWPSFAAEIDRNNPLTRMVIAYVKPIKGNMMVDKIVISEIDSVKPFTPESIVAYSGKDVNIIMTKSPPMNAANGHFCYCIIGSKDQVRELLEKEFDLQTKDMEALYPQTK